MAEWISVKDRLPGPGKIVLVYQNYSWTRFEDGAAVTIGRLHRPSPAALLRPRLLHPGRVGDLWADNRFLGFSIRVRGAGGCWGEGKIGDKFYG